MAKPNASAQKQAAVHIAAMQNQAATGVHGSPKKVTQFAYEETQNDEIEVLRSIYMDDYTDVEVKSAWSKNTERSFKLLLSAPSDRSISLVLLVTMSATYPRTIPLLRADHFSNVRKEYSDRITSVLTQKPKELIGEVMIHQIAEDLQELLEESATLRARDQNTLSLEEERAVHEAAAARRAEEEQAALNQLEEDQKAEQNRRMQHILEDEKKKRDKAKSKRRLELEAVNTAPEIEIVTFDDNITIREDKASEYSFRSVFLTRILATKQNTKVYEATPATSSLSSTFIVLKRIVFKNAQSGQPILDLEELLERLKHIRHANVTNLLAFRLENVDQEWTCSILTEGADRGSLVGMLTVVEALSAKKTKSFGIELLKGIPHLLKPPSIQLIEYSLGVLSQEWCGTWQASLGKYTFQETSFRGAHTVACRCWVSGNIFQSRS